MTTSKNYLTRMAQVDALKLDNEIVEIFKKQIYEVLKYLPSGLAIKYDPEITLLLRLFMFNYSLVTHKATFGQQLLAIKYERIPNKKLLLYAILTHGLNYVKDRLVSMHSDTLPDINLTRLVDRIEGLLLLVNLFNFLSFLRSGEKPLLIDRILDLKQISTQRRYLNNNIHSFMSREILWHTFIELLVILVPLINYHSLVRRLKSLCNLNVDKTKSTEAPPCYSIITRCPHCNEKPINPHHMGCAHIFCYYCLKGNLDADIGYICPTCNHSGRKCIKYYL